MSDAATSEALQVIDRSQQFILLVLGGVALSYITTGAQKTLLLSEGEDAACFAQSLRSTRLLGNLLILCALLFFFALSEQTARTPADSCRQEASHQANFLAGALALAAGLLRLWDVLFWQE